MSSNFAAIDLKGHFRKNLTWIFKFGWFSWYHFYVYQKVKLNYLMQNSMVTVFAIGTNFKSQKNEKPKSSYALFHIETNLIKQRFFLFSGPFWTVGIFLPSRSEAEKLALSDNKNLFAQQTLSKGTFLLYADKIQINKLCYYSAYVTMQNKFVHLSMLLREKSTQIKEHPSWEASINIKKIFWFVYTKLHSSTLVCFRLQSFTKYLGLTLVFV